MTLFECVLNGLLLALFLNIMLEFPITCKSKIPSYFVDSWLCFMPSNATYPGIVSRIHMVAEVPSMDAYYITLVHLFYLLLLFWGYLFGFCGSLSNKMWKNVVINDVKNVFGPEHSICICTKSLMLSGPDVYFWDLSFRLISFYVYVSSEGSLMCKLV